MAAIERYSTSVEERATVCCFLELQEKGLRPRYIMNALVEVKSSLFPAQSALSRHVSGEANDDG